MDDSTSDSLSMSTNEAGRLGGLSRALKLTSEQRSEQARKAGRANSKLPKATHVGELEIGDIKIACAVLEDGRRVITQSSILQALGRSRQGMATRGRKPKLVQEACEAGRQIPIFVAANNLIPFINKDLSSSSIPGASFL